MQKMLPAPATTGALARFQLKLRPGERWFIVGKTGSGKSVFARYLMRRWRAAGWPVLIIDPKHAYVDTLRGATYAENPQESTIEHPWRISGQWQEDVPVQIYLPAMPALRDPLLDALLFEALERGDCVVEFEDTHGMMTAVSAPEGYNALVTEGRAKRVTVLTLSQRPFQVPDVAMSQSEHFVIFRQHGSRNIHRMVETTQDEAVGYPLPRFAFRYWHEDMERTRKFAPLPREEVNVRDSRAGRATDGATNGTGRAENRTLSR